MDRAEQSSEKQQNAPKVPEQSQKILELEVSRYLKEIQRERKYIQQLEKESDHYSNKANSLMQSVEQKLVASEEKDGEIVDWRKQLSDAEKKLKQQEILLETVMGERNTYMRYINKDDEKITEIKTRIRTMGKPVIWLRDMILGKGPALVRIQKEHKYLDRSNETLEREGEAAKLQLKARKLGTFKQKLEWKKLQKILTDGEIKQIQPKRQLEHVLIERGHLAKQLLQCNYEGALLCEKIKIQDSVLSKVDFNFNRRMEYVQLLNAEFKRLECKKKHLDQNNTTAELRKDLFLLRQDLHREMLVTRALEERQRPKNVHRWRDLEETDPDKYELIKKFQALQKQVMAKTQKVEERQVLLQEKERSFAKLKHFLARQPGPEAAEQLQQYEWTLADVNAKIHVLTGQIRTLDSEIDEYKRDSQRLDSQLADFRMRLKLNKMNKIQVVLEEDEVPTRVDRLPPLHGVSMVSQSAPTNPVARRPADTSKQTDLTAS